MRAHARDARSKDASFATRRYRLERPRRLRGNRGPRDHFDGDFDESMDPKRQWTKTLVHNTLVDALVRFVKDCGMVDVRYEFKYWDPVRVGSDGSRRVLLEDCLEPLQRAGIDSVVNQHDRGAVVCVGLKWHGTRHDTESH